MDVDYETLEKARDFFTHFEKISHAVMYAGSVNPVVKFVLGIFSFSLGLIVIGLLMPIILIVMMIYTFVEFVFKFVIGFVRLMKEFGDEVVEEFVKFFG